MTPYSMWTKEALIKELQQKQEYIAEKECQIFVLAKTNNEFAKDLQDTIDTAAGLIKDYQIIETETLKQLHLKCKQIEEAYKVLEGCCDKDECCLFTDDGVCYDDECLIAEAKTILKGVKP